MRTEVKHSESKTAWNIVGKQLGGLHKVARIPYYIDPRMSEEFNSNNRKQALSLAKFISKALTHYNP